MGETDYMCLALKCKSQSKKQHFSIHILILAVWELKNAATTALLLSNDIDIVNRIFSNNWVTMQVGENYKGGQMFTIQYK